MRIAATPLLFLLLTGIASAQPGGPGPQRGERLFDRQVDRQQLRGELRGATRPQRPADSDPTAVATADPVPVTPVRHLSPRERAELRQQLRREQADGRRANP